jgi:signal transduction histidine kinase
MYLHHKEYKVLQDEKLHAEMNAIKMERLYIANELHNDIVPILASIRFRLGLAEAKNLEEAEKCNEALSHCIQQIRIVVRDLTPIGFYDKSFQQAIKEFIETGFINSTVKIDFIEYEYVELNGNKNEYVYRILQEIIENALKHSKANKLIIEISKENENLLIRTSDDGVGFDLDEITKTGKRGFGLVGIQNKIDYLKGTIHVNSRKNKGTKYNIRIPMSDV